MLKFRRYLVLRGFVWSMEILEFLNLFIFCPDRLICPDCLFRKHINGVGVVTSRTARSYWFSNSHLKLKERTLSINQSKEVSVIAISDWLLDQNARFKLKLVQYRIEIETINSLFR